MKRIALIAALVLAAAAPLQAQNPDPVTSGRGSVFVGPYAGYMIFGDLFENPDGTELSNENGGFYGVQAGYSFSPNFSLLGNFGYTKSKFVLEDNSGVNTNLSGDLGIFLYDASLQFRLPFTVGSNNWLAPFAQVGAGGIKYTFDYNDFNSNGNSDVAFNVGLGGDFVINKSVGLRVMVKDYITSLDWNQLDDVDFDDNVKGNVAHNWAITAGLNFGF